jgi:hypothetical protein
MVYELAKGHIFEIRNPKVLGTFLCFSLEYHISCCLALLKLSVFYKPQMKRKPF